MTSRHCGDFPQGVAQRVHAESIMEDLGAGRRGFLAERPSRARPTRRVSPSRPTSTIAIYLVTAPWLSTAVESGKCGTETHPRNALKAGEKRSWCQRGERIPRDCQLWRASRGFFCEESAQCDFVNSAFKWATKEGPLLKGTRAESDSTSRTARSTPTPPIEARARSCHRQGGVALLSSRCSRRCGYGITASRPLGLE